MTKPKTLSAVSEKLAYSPAEVEEQLGISHAKLFELLRTKKIRHFKIGRCTRISREALAEYVRAREAESTGVAA